MTMRDWRKAKDAAAELEVSRRTITNWLAEMTDEDRRRLTVKLGRMCGGGLDLWIDVPGLRAWSAAREDVAVLSTTRAAEVLGVARRTVTRWARRGADGCALDSAGNWRVFDLEALERWAGLAPAKG